MGIAPAIGDAILERAAEMDCMTNEGTLELLQWCTLRRLLLKPKSAGVTDALLSRYPARACAVLEDVRISWCPHLLEVEALLLKIRNTSAAHQEDEPCPLRHLDLSGNEQLSDGILKALAGRCPELSTLILASCAGLTGSFLPRLAGGCPSLTSFSIDGCKGIPDSLMSDFITESEAFSSGSLHSLSVGGCAVGALTVQALVPRGTYLRQLSLDGCLGIGDAAVRMLCRACINLTGLSLLGCPGVTCRGAWHATQHPSIEQLTITLRLSPDPDVVPPEKEAAQGRRGASAGKGIPLRSTEHRAGHDVAPDERRTEDYRTGTLADHAKRWRCNRCTYLNAISRTVCEICRGPRLDADVVDPAPAPGPPVGSPPPSPSRSSAQALPPGPSLVDTPLPLPAIPPDGSLKRLRLEVCLVSGENTGATAGDEAGQAPQPRGSCTFPLRRLSPLLPPKLIALDVRSSHASPPPWVRLAQGGHAHGFADDREERVPQSPRREKAKGYFSRWATAPCASPGSREDERAPAFEGLGEHRYEANGREAGLPEGHAIPVRPGVSIVATPLDVLSVVSACPSLQELTICGQPQRKPATTPSYGARIRGRGADARKTTAIAGVHATAAAVASIFRHRGGDLRRADGSIAALDGGATSQAYRASKPLRALTVLDCPSLPPLAVLEAIAIEDGAGLEHVAVGFSPALASWSSRHRKTDGRRASHAAAGETDSRESCTAALGLVTGSPGDGEPGEPRHEDVPINVASQMFQGLDVAGEDSVHVNVTSEVLRDLYVAGEDRLAGIHIRCPRLDTMELVHCSALRNLDVVATPALTSVRVENCGIGNKDATSLTKNCWRLERVNFAGNATIGDPALLSALIECPRLKVLHLHDCRAIGGSGSLAAFLLRQEASSTHANGAMLSNVHELTVSDAPSFTGAHFAAIAVALPCLRRMSVSRCRGLTEIAFRDVFCPSGPGPALMGWSEGEAEERGLGDEDKTHVDKGDALDMCERDAVAGDATCENAVNDHRAARGGSCVKSKKAGRRGNRKKHTVAQEGSTTEGSTAENKETPSTDAPREACTVAKSARGKRHHNAEQSETDSAHVLQGLELRVDGKTRAKLERLAELLPREPGRKKDGRPSCIRFLQGTCSRCAADCTWAHLPMHPPKTLKFKPLITQAVEPVEQRSSARPGRTKAAPLSSRQGEGRVPSAGHGKAPAAHLEARVSTAAYLGSNDVTAHKGDGRTPVMYGESDSPGMEIIFPNLQVMEIDACPRLKQLEGLHFPALAVARISECRELTNLSIDTPILTRLDVSGCVRLEPWELLPSGSSSGLQVAILNYCRALPPKFLAQLVDNARHLRRLEIYGAAAMMGAHGPSGSSRAKKEMTAGKRDASRADYNRVYTKTTAILKGLEKGRPKLSVLRTKKEFAKEIEGCF